jgi:uncharacterized damage-inducible protein DinB
MLGLKTNVRYASEAHTNFFNKLNFDTLELRNIWKRRRRENTPQANEILEVFSFVHASQYDFVTTKVPSNTPKLESQNYNRSMTELLELLDYQRWATLKTLDSVAKLSSEQLHRDLSSSFKGVFETLVHLYGADRAWLGRLTDQNPSRPNLADYPSLVALREAWEVVLDDWKPVVTTLENPKLEIQYKSYDGLQFSSSLEEIVKHVVNHGTYHRGQVAAMQRMLGGEAVGTDLISFYRARTPKL